MRIEIASDQHEGEEFVAWLNEQGHEASLGGTNWNYIDGEHTANTPELNETMNNLWDQYCNG